MVKIGIFRVRTSTLCEQYKNDAIKSRITKKSSVQRTLAVKTQKYNLNSSKTETIRGTKHLFIDTGKLRCNWTLLEFLGHC